ncbi:MAG: hypothetical protein ACRCXE_01485, partial [Metamycoplasmataceae bacterium]
LTQLEIDEMLDVNLEIITAGMDYKVILSPKNIYVTINGQSNAFSSNDFALQITNLVITKAATIPTDILLEDIEDPEVIKSKEFLSKLFNVGALTQLEIDEMLDISIGTIVEQRTYKIILSPRNIYVKINDSYDDFESNQFTLSEAINISVIVRNPIVLDITTVDVNAENLSTLATLSKVFRFDASMTQALLDEAVTVRLNENTLDGLTARSITLTRKYGYAINGRTSITSRIFIVQTIMTNVTVIQNPPLVLNTNDITYGLYWVRNLQNFFTLTEEQIENNINAVVNGNIYSGELLTITITAKDGFIFPGGRQITSVPFRVDIVMHFVAKTTPSSGLTVNILTNHLNENNTLSKLFWQYSVEDLNNITARVDGEIRVGNNVTVTIIAKDGYTFANGKNLVSNSFVIEADE